MLLKTNRNELVLKFFRYMFRQLEITNSGKYERHFKYLQVRHIPVPPLKTQQQFVKTVVSHEAAITAAETLLATAPARKFAILQKHLS